MAAQTTRSKFWRIFPVLLILIGVLITGSIASAGVQTAPAVQQAKSNYKIERIATDTHHDVSPPVRSMPTVSPEQLKNEALQAIREIPEGGPQGANNGVKPNGFKGDPLAQLALGPRLIPTPIVSFDTFSNLCGCSPPDPDGDIGPNHYVQMSNLHFAIYSRTGTQLQAPVANNTLWAGFGGPCQTSNSGDPIVLHDQMADRWVLTQFTASNPYYQCVAVSQTADPTGAYYRYGFNMGNQFGDYPKYAVWPDAYYLSERDFTNGSSQNGQGLSALERSQMLVGGTAQLVQFRVPFTTPYLPGDGLLFADLDGSTLPPAGEPAFVVGSQDNGGPYGAPSDALNIWKFHVDWVTPANSTLTGPTTLPVASFDSILDLCGGGRNCIPQPGTTNKIDHLGYRQRPTQRLSYRNIAGHEMLLTGQSVEGAPGIAGMVWWEIRDPNGTPFIYQQGTYAPGATDGIHRWMGSLAMDSSGNIALGYSASDGTVTYPSSAYTGRLNGDPLGQMTQGEAFFRVGTGSQTGSQRWGDYTAMHIDPVDDCTFWYVNEFIPTTSSIGWKGTVGSFKFPGCVAGGGTPTPTSTGTPPTATNTAVPPTATRTNTPVTPSPTACGQTTLINEGFETGLGVFSNVVATCVPGGCNWTQVNTDKHTGTFSAFAPDLTNISDQYLQLTNSIAIPAGSSSATLSFWHRVALEDTFDGGVLEFSTDGGTTWSVTVPNFISGGYTDIISSNFGSPIAGRDAWSGTIGAVGAFVQVQVNLNSYIGQSNFKFRFREANDNSVAVTGWWVDDVTLTIGTTCVTNTPAPPTNTSVPPTNTSVPPTNTSVPPTSTTEPPTNTSVPATATSTACSLQFEDVPANSTFYTWIRCLACRGIINGYPCGGTGEPCNPNNDPYFRPGNSLTRGQLAKIVANSAGLNDPVSGQTFEDVLPGTAFYTYTERLYAIGAIGGYQCGIDPGEPCGPGNRPYYRPGASITRGQLTKIVSQAAGFTDPAPATYTFTDAPVGSTFHVYIERLLINRPGVMSGYPCGGPGEPCDNQNRPYFRVNATLTRGQASKIVANTFFPNCQTPSR